MKIGDMQIRKRWTARIVSNGSVFGDLVQNSRTAFTRILMGGGGGGIYVYKIRYTLQIRRQKTFYLSRINMMLLIVFVT